jgi:transcriptional regulator with XRE-family HTH domain
MTAAENLDPDGSLWNTLAYQLRFERQKRGLSQAQVAEIMGVNKYGVSNAEAGRNKLTKYQADQIDRVWNTGGLFARLRRFAKQKFEPDWRARAESYQRQAIQHKIFHNDFIPIPFQTVDYARRLLGAGQATGYIDDLEEAVARRMELQEAILRCQGQRPHIWAVLDEVTLRAMGPPEVMKAQIDHLIEMSDLPNVSLRLLELSAAPHIGIDGSFWCFEMPDHRHTAFVGASIDVGRAVDDPAEAGKAVARFDSIAARALNEEQSRELLVRMSENL